MTPANILKKNGYNPEINHLMATFLIPTPLRKFAGNQSSVTVSAERMDQAIHTLVAQHPDLGRHLLDPERNVRSFVRIYVGDTDFRELQGEQTPLADHSVVSIIPAIAGGCACHRP